MTRFNITLSTAGVCKGNPGKGGYACILRFGDKSKEISGHESKTTSNKMVLKAIVEGIRALKKPTDVTVCTNLQYACTGIVHAKEWRDNGWKTKTGAQCRNAELWKELIELESAGGHHIAFRFENTEDPECKKLAEDECEVA